MSDEKQAALLISQSVATFIEAMGMHWENVQREQRGESIAYPEKAFQELLQNSSIQWNDALTLLGR